MNSIFLREEIFPLDSSFFTKYPLLLDRDFQVAIVRSDRWNSSAKQEDEDRARAPFAWSKEEL